MAKELLKNTRRGSKPIRSAVRGVRKLSIVCTASAADPVLGAAATRLAVVKFDFDS